MIASENEILDMAKAIPAVYKITNLVNGKFYIGSTTHYRKRRSQHFYLLRHNRHSNPYLQQAFNKYGESNFKIEMLTPVTPDELLMMEQMFIDVTNSANRLVGYNICAIAGKPNGIPKGSVRSEETKQKIRKANTGRKMSDEARANMRHARKLLYASGYVNPGKGKKLSDEHRAKLSIAHMGQVAHNKGKPLSLWHKKLFCGASFKRPMLHLDRDGNVIAEYESVTVARLATGKAQHVITGKAVRPQKDGSRWEYKPK